MVAITTQLGSDEAEKLFIEAMKPIWPNLIKKQTRFDFMNRNHHTISDRFSERAGGITKDEMLSHFG